jgi:hypothetical protein
VLGRSKQSEVKANIKSAYTSSRSYPNEKDVTGDDMSITDLEGGHARSATFLLKRSPAFTAANPSPLGRSNYTMILPGSINDSTSPAGDGYAILKVSTGGLVTASGRYADGTVLHMATPLSYDLTWPFYQPLYQSAGTNGEAIGSMQFYNANQGPSGFIDWIKGASADALYPGGFSNHIAVATSPFVAVPAGTRVIDVPNLGIVLQDGALNAAIIKTNATYGGTPAKITIPPLTNPEKLTVTISPSGLLTGSFIAHPGTPATKFFGAVLQNSNLASGYFIGSNSVGLKSSGYVTTQDQEKATPRH